MKRLLPYIFIVLSSYVIWLLLFICFCMLTEWIHPVLSVYKYNGSMLIYFCEFAVPESLKISTFGLLFGVIVSIIMKLSNDSTKHNDAIK